MSIISCTKSGHIAEDGAHGLAPEYSYIETTALKAVDTIQSFPDEMPISLQTLNDKLVVFFAFQDTTIKFYDIQKKDLIGYTGIKGRGNSEVITPQPLCCPYFDDNRDLYCYDSNGYKLLRIDTDSMGIEKISLPKQTINNSCLSYDEKLLISNPISDEDHIFSMYKFDTHELLNIEYPFSLSTRTKAKMDGGASYLKSPYLNTNFNRGRVIASMYFMDCYYVYDFQGNLLKSLSLSDSDFDADDYLSGYIDFNDRGIARYTYGYATDEYCYLERLIETPTASKDMYETKKTQIVKIDWDGNPKVIFEIPNNIGRFCVDNEGSLIAITDEIVDDRQIFSIIKFEPKD